jgi:hypothetical protein
MEKRISARVIRSTFERFVAPGTGSTEDERE